MQERVWCREAGIKSSGRPIPFDNAAARSVDLSESRRHRNKDYGSWYKDRLTSLILVLLKSSNIQK
jgi:hypothetical protein